jgi:hypothetical protein
MSRWEPLPQTIGLDARRLATQLRRMKDHSGLSVPALAARTARGTEDWERYLNGKALPPRDAAEVLGQLSGADYERLVALWDLAERSWQDSEAGVATSRGPVPDPDPLDPLGPEKGLPSRRRRGTVLVVGVGLTLVSVLGLLARGIGTERVDGNVVPAASGSGHGAPSGPSPSGSVATAPVGSQLAAPDAGLSGPAASATGTGGPVASAASGGRGAEATGTGSGSGGSSGSGGGTRPGQPGTTASPGPGTPTAPTGTTPTASASATSGGVCLGVIVLNICVG